MTSAPKPEDLANDLGNTINLKLDKVRLKTKVQSSNKFHFIYSGEC